MALKMILTGDINLMGVEDPAVPFSNVEQEFRSAFAKIEGETRARQSRGRPRRRRAKR